jgi:hypothetical protein
MSKQQTLPALREDDHGVQPYSGPDRQLTALDVVREALTNPEVSPEKAREAFALYRDMQKWQAEQDGIAAFSRLKFPPITKTKKGAKAHYSPFDQIQEIVDPILEAEGFRLSHRSGAPDERGMVPTTAVVTHRLGYEREATVYLPQEKITSRAGDVVMNASQAMGSATSYGQRYSTKLLLNLRFVDEDDDAEGTSMLTKDERESIEDLLHEIGSAALPKFLEFLGVKAVGDIQRGAFRAAVNYLQAKRRQMGAK